MSRSTIVLVLVLCAVAFTCGFIVSRSVCGGERVVVEERTDTLVVRDTTVLTKVVTRIVEKTVTDTVRLYSVDSVLVEASVPVEYAVSSFSDADVWHHGFRSVVDSVRVFPETRYVTQTVTERIPAPRLGFGIHAGYGASRDGLSPYIGIGIQYNLLPLGNRKKK